MHSAAGGLGNEVTDVFFNESEVSDNRSSGACPKNGSGDGRAGPGNKGLQ